MKTLVVTNLPAGDASWTNKALQSFLAAADLSDLTAVDLCSEEPSFISSAVLAAYVKRSFAGEQLSAVETMVIEEADIACEQLIECDLLVLAFPMYNFCMPAATKAWFDQVIQCGKTYDVGEGGRGFRGLLAGKKAVVFMASGGTYIEEPTKSFDHAEPLTRQLLGFMGFDVEFVRVQGTAGHGGDPQLALAAAQAQATALAQKIYAQS